MDDVAMSAATTGGLDALWQSFAGFAWPWVLLALPLPWLARWLLPAMRSTSAALKVPYGERLDAIATPSTRGGGTPMAWIAYAAWCALCIAAARPQAWGDVVQPPQAGRDLMLAVDLSGSMGEEDMQLGGALVDRLTAAKAVLADFLERRAGDRVGLLVFGQKAYALTPLTRDLQSVREQLTDSVVGLAGRETAIGDAVGLAVKRLRTQDSGQRVLVLLTDGVNTAGLLDPLKAAELARDNDIRIHTIAFGGEGDLSVFGFRLPGAGEAEIDEDTLRRIATMTGGRSFRARDTESLAGIYAEIDRLEPVKRAGQRVRPRNERYVWPLAMALACSVLALAWPRRRMA
jgi:Ca-activated chloride channel family protein